MTDSELEKTLETRLFEVRSRIKNACLRANRAENTVTLVAVTKKVSSRVVSVIRSLGIRDFGENRPQELWKKSAIITDVNWHLIGHLQRNKINQTASLTSLIHSADSERLLSALNEFAVKTAKKVSVLLEVNCSREEAKGGFKPGSEMTLIVDKLKDWPGLQVDGLMTMAAFHENPEDCRATFQELRRLRDDLESKTGRAWPTLSMGMSNDFEVAIEEGASHVRIGTTLFEGLESVE
jgi:PLP dependent protein